MVRTRDQHHATGLTCSLLSIGRSGYFTAICLLSLYHFLVGRQLLVLFALHRPQEHHSAARARSGFLVASRPLCWWPGACGAASTLRALLAQSSVRCRRGGPSRALLEAGAPGHDSGQRRREDVEKPRKRDQSRRYHCRARS